MTVCAVFPFSKYMARYGYVVFAVRVQSALMSLSLCVNSLSANQKPHQRIYEPVPGYLVAALNKRYRTVLNTRDIRTWRTWDLFCLCSLNGTLPAAASCLCSKMHINSTTHASAFFSHTVLRHYKCDLNSELAERWSLSSSFEPTRWPKIDASNTMEFLLLVQADKTVTWCIYVPSRSPSLKLFLPT